MKRHKKLAAFLSSVGVFCLSTAARADVISYGGNFSNARPGESSAYGFLAIAAVVCVVAVIALVIFGDMRRRRASKESIKNNNRK
jgi:hypothetical protein